MWDYTKDEPEDLWDYTEDELDIIHSKPKISINPDNAKVVQYVGYSLIVPLWTNYVAISKVYNKSLLFAYSHKPEFEGVDWHWTNGNYERLPYIVDFDGDASTTLQKV